MSESEPAHSAYGVHIAMECSGCRDDLLRDQDALERSMVRCAEEAGATVLKALIHAFNPAGLSGVVVIAESHVAIHTWPEIGYASFDIYTCGQESLAVEIADKLERVFQPSETKRQLLERRPPS